MDEVMVIKNEWCGDTSSFMNSSDDSERNSHMNKESAECGHEVTESQSAAATQDACFRIQNKSLNVPVITCLNQTATFKALANILWILETV
jgi:hypothetical protein